jgi:hypothetical protein
MAGIRARMIAMSNRAEGTFNLDYWEAEKPYDEHEGTQLTRVHVGKTFSGR